MQIILAIDGGGSRTRCLAMDRHGLVLGRGASGPSNHLLVSRSNATRSIAESIHQTLGQDLNRNAVVCVVAGMAGVDFDEQGASDIEEMLQGLGFSRVLVTGDIVIAHIGALAYRPGVIALAGTGSAVLGIASNGERFKVGGWGPVYGDEGSSYRIGQTALRAAARAVDGRGPATHLTGALLRNLGLKEFRDTIRRVYVEGMTTSEIAALSRVANEVAQQGDEVARSILANAGEELAEAVGVAVRWLLQHETAVTVSYQGGLIESNDIVRETFREGLIRLFPELKVAPPEFEPIIGAYLLGCKEVGWSIDNEMLSGLASYSGMASN